MNYQVLNATSVLRLADGAAIPADPANRDYQDYLAWLAAGHTPLPAPSMGEKPPASTAFEKAETSKRKYWEKH